MAVDSYNRDQPNNNTLPKEEYSDIGKVYPVREFGEMKKIKKASKIVSIAITIVGAGIILGSIVQYSFIYKPTAIIEKFELTADDNNVYYDIIVKDMEPETIKLKLYNQFEKYEEVIILGKNTGTFTNLVKDMTYTVSIVEKDVLVTKKKITTTYVEPKE